MANYKKILLATDLSEFSGLVGGKALAIATTFNAELSLLHVMEFLPMLDSSYSEILPMEIDINEQMLEIAKGKLEELAKDLSIPKERQLLELGSPKSEIVRVAKENGFEMIIVGTHGRRGLGILLGSTAASVIHHASCDVLTIRLRDG
jgi:universal stress protein A